MHNATATKKNSLPNYCCSQKEEGKQGGTWGITQKNSPHAKFERACDKTTKIDSTFRGTLPMSNFFPLLLTRWDDVSSRWGPLLNLSFFFSPTVLISDLFIYYLRCILIFWSDISFSHIFFFARVMG
jgi:hypothetical protein